MRVLGGVFIFASILLWGSGCGPDVQTCAEGEMACSGSCVDLATHPDHCGECGNDCGDGMACVDSDCIEAEPECEPGEVRDCYTGPAGTASVGECHGGQATCTASALWGDCEGQALPLSEDCSNGLDENCNGEADEDRDIDADGFSTCNGDCCDATGDGCEQPELVNPGSFEVDGNELDDDCDGGYDNAADVCDMGLASNSNDPMDYARAIGLCREATDDDGRWGVLSARLVLPDGSGAPNSGSRAIRSDFGATMVRQGTSMAVLSTGRAADQADTNPAYLAFQGGQPTGTSSPAPADYLAANGGAFPNSPGCPAAVSVSANDGVMLELEVRVPTNAQSFSMSADFFSSEYPEWVCSPYNDFFVILLDSTYTGDTPNPADKNLATYTAPDDSVYPVGVNLAFGDTGLFRQCLNGPTGCASPAAVDGETTTCVATTELVGTGFDVLNPPKAHGSKGWCGTSNMAGGATGWLATRGNVVAGEVITLRIAVWDTGDEFFDSLVLIDNFDWSVVVSEPGTIVD